jgi:hypothetical protein
MTNLVPSLLRTSLVLLLALSTGCYTIRYHRRVERETGDHYERWHHNFFDGLWEASDPVNVDEICPNGVAVVENNVSVTNALGTLGAQILMGVAIGALSQSAPVNLQERIGGSVVGTQVFSWWSPTTVNVVCAKGVPRATAVTIAAGKRRIAVVPLEATLGVTKETAALFTESLVGELRKQGNSVISQSDIGTMLGVERQKALLGCADDSCLAEIGGALGVDRIVHGTLGRVGGSLVVYLSSLDPKKARTTASVSERLKSPSDEVFLDALPRMATQLMAEPVPSPTSH